MIRPSLAASLLALAAAAPGQDWPQFRGPNRDGLSPDKGLLKTWPEGGPPLAWKATGLGQGYSSVAVAGDRVYTMGDDKGSSYVFARDRKTGDPLWSAKVGKAGGNYAGTRCTPTVDGDRAYALGQYGDLVCLKTADGGEVWRKNLKADFGGSSGGWNYTESPLVDGDRLVCTPGGKTATMVALDKNTGEVIWKCPIADTPAGYASAVVSEAGGVRQYVQLLADGVAAVAARDGKLLWRYGTDGTRFAGNTANIPTCIVQGEQVFCCAGYGRGGGLVTVTAGGGAPAAKEEYFNKELTNKHGGRVIVGDYVYGDRDDSGQPQCARWKTGEVVWQRKRDRDAKPAGSASVCYADGFLYVRYDNGYVALVPATPDGYKEAGLFKIPNSDKQSWSHPVVIGGRLYLREKDTLWCYDVTAK